MQILASGVKEAGCEYVAIYVTFFIGKDHRQLVPPWEDLERCKYHSTTPALNLTELTPSGDCGPSQ